MVERLRTNKNGSGEDKKTMTFGRRHLTCHPASNTASVADAGDHLLK